MANITRFDPLGEMVSLRSAMDRLFEDSFVSPMSWRTIGGGESINPPVDVHETRGRAGRDRVASRHAVPRTSTSRSPARPSPCGASSRPTRRSSATSTCTASAGSARSAAPSSCRCASRATQAKATFTDGILTLAHPEGRRGRSPGRSASMPTATARRSTRRRRPDVERERREATADARRPAPRPADPSALHHQHRRGAGQLPSADAAHLRGGGPPRPATTQQPPPLQRGGHPSAFGSFGSSRAGSE